MAMQPASTGRPRPQGLHVVWDWNGTLLDDAAAVIQATSAAFAAAGLAVEVTEASYRHHFTRPIPLFYERLLGRPVGPDEWIRLDRAFHDEYARVDARCSLREGAAAALEEVRRRGWTQSVCSMLPHTHLLPAVERQGIASYFVRIDGLRGGERGGAKLAHLVAHLESLETPASRAVLVGDTVDDALAARGAGIGCILLGSGIGLHEPAALAASGAPLATSLRQAVLMAAGAALGTG